MFIMYMIVGYDRNTLVLRARASKEQPPVKNNAEVLNGDAYRYASISIYESVGPGGGLFANAITTSTFGIITLSS